MGGEGGGGLMEFYLSYTQKTTQGEMHAPNNIIPPSVRVRHTPNTSHISLCAVCTDKVSIKLLVGRQKWLHLLRAERSYPEEWSYPSYMIRPSVLLSLEASRLNQGKPWWQLSWCTGCCSMLSVFNLRPWIHIFGLGVITQPRWSQSCWYTSQTLF